MGLTGTKWAVFISGTGSNLSALLDVMEVRLVITSRADAYGQLRAKRLGVPVMQLEKTVDWEALHQTLLNYGIEKIFLAGFMKILPSSFLDPWRKKIWNLHPSLLPLYPGQESLKRAYAERSDIGLTLHEVVPEVDAGPIVVQRCLPRALQFDEMAFQTHVQEHRLMREVVASCKM